MGPVKLPVHLSLPIPPEYAKKSCSLSKTAIICLEALSGGIIQPLVSRNKHRSLQKNRKLCVNKGIAPNYGKPQSLEESVALQFIHERLPLNAKSV